MKNCQTIDGPLTMILLIDPLSVTPTCFADCWMDYNAVWCKYFMVFVYFSIQVPSSGQFQFLQYFHSKLRTIL